MYGKLFLHVQNLVCTLIQHIFSLEQCPVFNILVCMETLVHELNSHLFDFFKYFLVTERW